MDEDLAAAMSTFLLTLLVEKLLISLDIGFAVFCVVAK
jgi:hypothetical protein